MFAQTPFARIWAQTGGTIKLLQVPKIALILGNSKYRDAPLRNPANDAKAISEALKACGFQVNLKVDADNADMAAAVQSYLQLLAAMKGVGLFYYAGHGIQLAWRNYMLPVNVDIDTIADIQRQGVELNSLLEGLTKAANPMNLIIVDACRDNPFGNLKGVDHKGLSQMDAPRNSILAYATSPGNVASDGDGRNGLYTEHLLREIEVREARVEDVFKRARLGVRVKSRGAQIPWESTSLEDDFYFLPPAILQKQSEAEKKKAFEEEQAFWEKARRTKEARPLEEYLQRYPNGNFSELAQFHLDRALAGLEEKKVAISSQEGNPYTKGSAMANTRFKPGDSYTYRLLDIFSRVEFRRFTATVVKIAETDVYYSNGRVTDLLGNVSVTNDGRRLTAYQNFPAEYAVGKRWVSRYTSVSQDGRTTSTAEIEFGVATRERITVPAGTFNAFRIEGVGYITDASSSVQMRQKFWLAPDQLRVAPAQEEVFTNSIGRMTFSYRQELESFKEG
ncbi:MAG: caspase family protein [Betaproteobacteria bacterium]|nr:caspase family protein [Betaproteobacteria bacterium]